MTIANWIPLIVAIIGLAGGAIVYQLQKSIDRVNQIKQERRELYRRFVIAFEDLDHNLTLARDDNNGISLMSSLDKTIAEIYVSAPDNVVAATRPISLLFASLGSLLYGGKKSISDISVMEARKELHLAWLNLIQEMRYDTFEKSKISKETLKEIFESFLTSVGKLPF